MSTQFTAAHTDVELSALRVAVVPSRDLLRQGRPVRSHGDAARILAPYLTMHHATRRLAGALTDNQDRLMAVALIDGPDESACCVRPGDVCEPLVLAGATRAWFAHCHLSRDLCLDRHDVVSIDRAQSLASELGLQVLDHLLVGRRHYATWRAALAAGVPLWPLLNRRRAFLKPQFPLPAQGKSVHPPLPAPAQPTLQLIGLQPTQVYSTGLRVPALPFIRSHADVAPFLAHFLYAPDSPTDWVAGLIDARSRLFAVALLNRTQRSSCVVAAAEVYRAVLVLGARSVYLAHAHDRGVAPSNVDCHSATKAHAMGYSLGYELADVLVFCAGRDYLSLRTLGLAVPVWRRALETGRPDRPARAMRAHQASVNRRPIPRQRPGSSRPPSA